MDRREMFILSEEIQVTTDEIESLRQQVAETFDRDHDPLAKYQDQFEKLETELDIDPFELYVRERLEPKDLAESTLNNHRRSIRFWKQFMEGTDRHPACPSEGHIREWVHSVIDDGNQPATARKYLNSLLMAYTYLQEESIFPMGADYHPFASVREKMDLTKEPPKEVHPMSLEDVRRKVQDIAHIRDRALVAIGFKLGLRVSEVCNIKIEDVHINNPDVLAHYDEMGTAPGLENRENAVYIPHDRKQNKSKRPRTIPFDDEMRKLLLDYLLIRPNVDEPWLFLSKRKFNKLHKENAAKVWENNFRPEYAETARYRAVRSHYGRHWFTTWFSETSSLTENEVRYLRGDKMHSGEIRSTRQAIDQYIHVYYEDVESKYRADIFKILL